MNNRPVLYAEDEENDAFFLRRAFKQLGIEHPLVVVQDGQEAIEYCAGTGVYSDRHKHPIPCLLLVDLNMPKKTGLDFLQWLRRESGLPRLPAIVLTSSTHKEDIRRAYLQGANAYVGKPSNPEELVPLVKAISDFWLTRNLTD